MKMRISHLFHARARPHYTIPYLGGDGSKSPWSILSLVLPHIYFKSHQIYLLAQSQLGRKWKQCPGRSCHAQLEGKKCQHKFWKGRRSWKGRTCTMTEQKCSDPADSAASLCFELSKQKVGIHFPVWLVFPEGPELMFIFSDFSLCSRSGFVSSFVVQCHKARLFFL